MLNRIIEWSLKNQLIVVLGLGLAILGGVLAIRDTTVDAIPDFARKVQKMAGKFKSESGEKEADKGENETTS